MLRQRAQFLLSRASAATTGKNRIKKNAVNLCHQRSTTSSAQLASYRAVSTLSSSGSSEDGFSSLWNATNTAVLIAAAAATTAFAISDSAAVTTDCCGIVGVIGTKEHSDAREFLLDGLTILKNRGYDSAGIATVPMEGGGLSISKYASDGDKADSIELVAKHSQHLGHTMGIAHTRWYVRHRYLSSIALLLFRFCRSRCMYLKYGSKHFEK